MLLAHEIDLTAGTELEVKNLALKTKRRKERPKKIIIDWSGNEMNAEEYAAFLRRGKTGTHLFIDHEGIVWQFADLWLAKVARWKGVDDDSIWITLQNKGVPPSDTRVARGVFVYEFGAFKKPVLAVNADQLDSLTEIIDLICRSMGILPHVPRKDGQLITHQLKPRTVRAWEGILLASHVAPTLSPGPGALPALAELEHKLLSEDEEEDEDGTDLDGEEQEVDDEAFNRDFPDPV
jgi:hypothetical protein